MKFEIISDSKIMSDQYKLTPFPSLPNETKKKSAHFY